MNNEKIQEILLIVDALESAIAKNDHRDIGRQLTLLRWAIKALSVVRKV